MVKMRKGVPSVNREGGRAYDLDRGNSMYEGSEARKYVLETKGSIF